MRNLPVIARWQPLVLALALLACSGTSVDTTLELKVGDMDPNAPEGWPLAIGDPDIAPWGRPGGVDARFEFWKGNCCINWVDGVPYTAKWRMGDIDGIPWDFYEGHVVAKPDTTRTYQDTTTIDAEAFRRWIESHDAEAFRRWVESHDDRGMVIKR